MKGYSTREVAEILGLPTSRILSWARSGLISPQRDARGAYVFSFPDIVLLRTARELLEAEVSSRRVREALEALRRQLPVGRPLSAVSISAVGDRVLVRDDEGVWEPDSGQLQIDFPVAEVAEAARPVAKVALAAARHEEEMGADDWYDCGVDLEAVSIEDAAAAYRRALEIEPAHPEAHLNLGRLLHEDGKLEDAERHYRASLLEDHASARAQYNLGVVLEDLGRPGPAGEAYDAALRSDPDLAAAHFNLSRLLESAGRSAEALGHLAEYKRLVDRLST